MNAAAQGTATAQYATAGCASCYTSMVIPHDHRPAASGAQRRSCSDAAFGAAPVISASLTSASGKTRMTPPSGAGRTVTATGISPSASSR